MGYIYGKMLKAEQECTFAGPMYCMQSGHTDAFCVSGHTTSVTSPCWPRSQQLYFRPGTTKPP